MIEVRGLKTESGKPFKFTYTTITPPGCKPMSEDVVSWKISVAGYDVLGMDSASSLIDWTVFCDDIIEIASSMERFGGKCE